MKNILAIVLFCSLASVCQAQTVDSVKTPRYYILQNESSRTSTPNIVKPGLKELKPIKDSTNTNKKTATQTRSKERCICKKRKRN